MILNGVYAEPGTLIGIHARTFKPLVVVDTVTYCVNIDQGDWINNTELRYATQEDAVVRHAVPRSIAEHRAIPRRSSPYGLIRQYVPIPLPRQSEQPSMVISRRTRRKLRRAVETGHIKHITTTGRYR